MAQSALDMNRQQEVAGITPKTSQFVLEPLLYPAAEIHSVQFLFSL